MTFLDYPSVGSPPPPVAFFCYARHDDDNENGRVSQLRARIESEVIAVSGRSFKIWQDQHNLRTGSEFDIQIEAVLDSADALLVLVTPSLLNSPYCRREIERFRDRRQYENVPPPIFSILYIDPFDTHNADDQLARYLRSIQFKNWTDLRHEDLDSKHYLRAVNRLANDINEALRAASGPNIDSRISGASSNLMPTSSGHTAHNAPVSDRAAGSASTLADIMYAAAARRAEIIASLSEGIHNGVYGVRHDTLYGPSGFKADLRARPDNWSNVTGITGTSIRIGNTTPLSGNLAAYGNIARGLANYFDWVNENDPVMVDETPRGIQLVVKDDGYVAVRTVALVDELIQHENVFSILTLGSPSTLAVYDKLNQECIPHPFAVSGHPAWGDPVNHPWTTGLQMSYSTEAILWGEWIKRNIEDLLPVRVSSVVMDNDFGLAYELGFEQWASANPQVVAEFVPVRHDPATSTLLPELDIIRRLNPDVFISMTAGNPCLLAIQEAYSSGLTHEVRARHGVMFTSSVGKGVAAYMAPAGRAGDGWLIVDGGVKDVTNPVNTEPFAEFITNNLQHAGLDPPVPLYGVGYVYGYPYVEALRVAAALPGGLTRTNFMLAVRALDIYHPLLSDGIKFRLNGNEDAFPVEGSSISRYHAALRTWMTDGETIDVTGSTPACAWDLEHGGCR